MTTQQIIHVLGQRAMLLDNALARGHLHQANHQHQRILMLADKLLYGVCVSKPETREAYDMTYNRSSREYYPPEEV